MECNRPILWRHGLFLQPQHFQLNDLFQQSRLAPLWEFIRPQFWGVAELNIQESALSTMTFEMLNGRFLFPDGTYVVFPGNAVLEPRSFDDAWENRDKPLTVYLGLRKISQVEANVEVVSEMKGLNDVTTRFVASATPDDVQDLYVNGQTGQVQGMLYHLRLFWESEKDQLDNYDLIPVARLEMMTERVRLLPGFIPPVLSLGRSERLFAIMRDIRDRLAARGRQLEGYKKLKSLDTGESDSHYTSYIMALACLNRHIPVLSQMCESGAAHPFDAYAALRQLIGELSTFSVSVDVMGETADGNKIPPYNHTGLWECFSQALNVIETALADFVTGPEYICMLEREGDTFSIDSFNKEIIQPRNHFFLVFWTTLELGQLLDALNRLTKVASKQYLPTIIKRALAGIELSFMAQPPREAPGRSNCFFFRLDESGKLWERIVTDQSIALYWDGAPADLKVELMVVRR